MPKLSRRNFVRSLIAGAIPVTTSGCGTLLYPERRGQRRGRLDMAVVALDCAGFLLFGVGGLIAFAIDFATGAIYLPECYSTDLQCARHDERLKVVHVPADELTVSRVEEVVSAHTGQRIALTRETTQTRPIRGIREFWSKARQLATPLA